MVLVSDNEPYLKYAIESIKDIVDEIVFLTPLQGGIPTEYMPINGKVVWQDIEEPDFASWRNQALKECTGDVILYLDSDEILANADGSPVERSQLEDILTNDYKFDDGKMYKADSFDLFTRHFMWNYFTIDARNGGLHWSSQRLFFVPKEPIRIEYQTHVHEVLTWYKWKESENKRKAYFQKQVRLTPNRRFEKINPTWAFVEFEGDKTPIIWHFGHCKGIEDMRQKYARTREIPDNPFRPEHMKYKDNDEYCVHQEKINGKLPCIHYAGKLPVCMKLW